MTQTTKRKTPTTLEDIPVVPRSKLRAKLRRRIRTCERRYEMSTEKMREVVRKDPLRETLEICDWLMADSLLKDLAEMERSTVGSPSTDTSRSTEAPSSDTRSSSKTGRSSTVRPDSRTGLCRPRSSSRSRSTSPSEQSSSRSSRQTLPVHAHIPGRHDNSHGPDEFHRHEYVFPTEDQKPLEVLTREEFPTLIEVLDEVQAVAADLGLAG